MDSWFSLFIYLNDTLMSNSTLQSSESEWISVQVGKFITAMVMFVSVLFIMFVPIMILSRFRAHRKDPSFNSKFKIWIGRLTCFSAGVFLSTGFMDIFPDVIKTIDEAGKKLNIKIEFPLASFFTLFGFFMILSVEQIIFYYNENMKTPKYKLVNDIKETDIDNEDKINDNSTEIEKEGISADHSSSVEEKEDFSIGEKDADEDNDNNILLHNKSRIVALMSAICVHAIFEGFAIGLGTTISGVAQLFLALSLHKWIIAASLGLNLATSKLKLWFKVLVALIFSLGSPLGIIAGIGVMQLKSNGSNVFFMVAGALEGVACGTFLYVVFFEILPHEMGSHSKEDRFGKVTGAIMGFALVTLYVLFV